MATPREQALAELRRAIDVLPERTRRAMLVGLENNIVITGAFSGGDGVCPMMAAHRAGGRTSCVSFPEAWDKFTGVYGRRIVREATQYEVDILRAEIEASLVPLPSLLGEAIAGHRATVEAHEHDAVAAQQQAIAEQQAIVEQRAIVEQHLVAEQQQPAVEEQPPVEPRRRRVRLSAGPPIDLGRAIEEHRASARSRRSREAQSVGLQWLFEDTLVLPDDFGHEHVGEAPADAEHDVSDRELAR